MISLPPMANFARFFFFLFLLLLLGLPSRTFATTARAGVVAQVQVQAPRPLTIGIDDAGWQGGSDLSARGGPPRLAMPHRDPVLDDYRAILRIAKAVGSRILMAWILSELDRADICAKPEYNAPLSSIDVTEFGLNWDNSRYVSDDNFELMNFARDESAYLEFALHGVRHEHFGASGGGATSASNSTEAQVIRAEFGPLQHKRILIKTKGGRRKVLKVQVVNETTWGADAYRTILDCFTELMRQYYSPDVCSFPRAFVPPAHGYYYSPKTNPHNSTGAIVSSYGVKYIQLPVRALALELEPGDGDTDDPFFFDGGAMAVHRDTRLLGKDTDTIGAVPTEYTENGRGPFLMTHLPNFLSNESEQKWVTYLSGINDAPHRYLPKSTAQLYSQQLYGRYCKIVDRGDGSIVIDNTAMAQAAYDKNILGTLVLKVAIATDEGQRQRMTITDAIVDKNAKVVAVWADDFGHAYMLIGHDTNAMGRLDRTEYRLRYEIGPEPMSDVVELGRSTYDVHSLRFFADEQQVWLTLQMYGAQRVDMRLSSLTPTSVLSTNPKLTVRRWEWHPEARLLTMTVHGLDMQGEKGTLIISGRFRQSGLLSVQPHLRSLDQSRPVEHPAKTAGAMFRCTQLQISFILLFFLFIYFGKQRLHNNVLSQEQELSSDCPSLALWQQARKNRQE